MLCGMVRRGVRRLVQQHRSMRRALTSVPVRPHESSTVSSQPPASSSHSFAHLLRHSSFMQLGDLRDRVLLGVVDVAADDDLYVDFGGKFHAVCRRPRANAKAYKRGAKVLIRLKDFELSTRFIGSDIDLTLLEADAILLGLAPEQIGTVDKNDA